MRPVRFLLALCAFFVPVSALAACGDSGIPGNAVAEVDGTAIERETYDHWFTVAAKSSGTGAAVPKPPEYTECIAEKKKVQPAEGQPKVTDAAAKKECEAQYKAIRDQVMSLLVSFEWIEREAKEQGVSVSDDEVKKSFDEQKKQTFPKDADFQKFLKDSGQTEEDVRQRVRLDLLSNKIRDKVIKGKDQVSDAEIKKYYDDNKERFAQPERRDVSMVLTKTKAKAEEAKQALDDGESFKAVAKEYSIDDASKAQGGKLPAVAKGQQDKAFDDAIFAAEKGEISGPVKSTFGFYVFKVDKITKASQQTQEEASETIKQLLASQNQQKALDAFVKDFRDKWKAKTDCREGFATQDCKNGPKATPTPTPGAVDGGTAPAPAPTTAPE